MEDFKKQSPFSWKLYWKIFKTNLAITTIKNNDARKKMLSQFTGDAEADFPAFSPAEWTHLLARLTLLLPSAGEEDTKLFLSHISGCDTFRALVSSLSQVYMSLSPVNQQGICSALLAFLENQHTMTGNMEVIGKKEEPLQFLSAFLEAFNTSVRKSSDFLGSTKVRETTLMMSAEIIFLQITDMSLEDTSTWLHRLRILLPYVNATALELLPLSVPCPHYQALIAAIDGVYSALSAQKKHDVYEFQKVYLTAQFRDSEIAWDIQRGMRNWIDINLRKFLQQSSLQDLIHFNAKFKELSAQSLKDLLGPNFGFHLEAGYSQQPSAERLIQRPLESHTGAHSVLCKGAAALSHSAFPSALHNLIVTDFADGFHSFPGESTPVKHFQTGLWESYQELERLFQTLEQITISVDNVCGFRTN